MGIQTRVQSTKDVWSQIVNVERAELMMVDPAAEPKVGTFLRLVTANGDPQKLDAAIVHIRNHVLPIAKA